MFVSVCDDERGGVWQVVFARIDDIQKQTKQNKTKQNKNCR